MAQTTTQQINSHINSDVDGLGQLVYFVDYTEDDGSQRRFESRDHAEVYAFVRDEILPA